MSANQERILLVESDFDICDLIARQTLQPMGYKVQVAGAAAQAIQEAARFAPDVIIANMKLPGLSGKDLLVAMTSQGLDAPVVVIAEKGMEGDVIQAFRLGASDFLYWPAREAEVLQAVERVLKQVRAKREREGLAKQVKQTNMELQKRVRELTTILAIGKAVTSITDQRALFDKIVEGGVSVTESTCGYLLLRDERAKAFLLSAHRNLPQAVAAKLDQPFDDGISSLVALSGESLTIHGDALKRFKVARLGQAALVVPVKIKNEVVGLLTVVRQPPQPFGPSNQTLLEAVADYASISLVNARLFKVLEERARSLQQAAEAAQMGERIKDDMLQNVNHELRTPLMGAKGYVDLVLDAPKGLSAEQVENLRISQEKLTQLTDIVESLTSLLQVENGKQRTAVDMNEMARQAVARFQKMAQQNKIAILTEFSPTPVMALANPSQIAKVLDGLLSNAIKFSPQGGQVALRVERTKERLVHVMVQDKGIGIEVQHLPHIFERFYQVDSSTTRRFGGLGVGLALVKEIVAAHGGKVWVESKIKQGSAFHFAIPAQG